MAGDSDLATARGHDPDDLWQWLWSYTRIRLLVPFFLLPCGYLIHRLTATPFNVPALIVVSCFTVPITFTSFALLRRWRNDVQAHARSLERLVTIQTLWEIIFTTIGVHYAGGATGLFWPFPFVAVIVGSALLPSRPALLLYSAVATAAVTLSAWVEGTAHIALPALLSIMFLGFSAFVSTAVAHRLGQRRWQRRELDRLRIEKELAEAIARRREEILSVVSHELASPLTTLRGYVRLMQEDKSRERSSSHLLQRIDRQVNRLSGLADDLLEMASTSAGAIRLRRSRFDLVEALREIAEAGRVQYPEADIDIEGVAQVNGVWDRDRLEQLFGNLVSNAVKFGGARCRVRFDLQKTESATVHVRVTDDGPGISAEALGRIFEPFQRYSAERGGLGLGLAIARAVAELHRGQIWAESPNGRGATFHVTLPTDAQPSGEHPTVAGVTIATARTEGVE